jgi:hypothetical protein
MTGCPRSQYLNTPPAAYLGLTYPAGKWKAREAAVRRRKVKALGFDPFDRWMP